MSILDERFAGKDDAVRAFEAEIKSETNDDGEEVFYWESSAVDALKTKLENEAKKSQANRKKKQELQARLDELEREREKERLELEELRERRPLDDQNSLKKYVDEATASRSKIAAQEKELEALRSENAAFKSKATRERIENELVAEARKRDCCETALRDVRRLASAFEISDETGVPQTKDGRLIVEVLDEEIAASPHWLKRSQGGGSAPGIGSKKSNAQKLREAMSGTSFDDVLRYSPRLDQ